VTLHNSSVLMHTPSRSAVACKLLRWLPCRPTPPQEFAKTLMPLTADAKVQLRIKWFFRREGGNARMQHVGGRESGVRRQKKGVPRGWFFFHCFFSINILFTTSCVSPVFFCDRNITTSQSTAKRSAVPREPPMRRRPALRQSPPTCGLRTATWTWCCPTAAPATTSGSFPFMSPSRLPGRLKWLMFASYLSLCSR
jgi:hypothetical protein